MYNRFQISLRNQSLYSKQFGFQGGHSAGSVMIKLVRQVLEAFENNLYTPDVFINLPNAADTVDHVILLKKLKLYGIKGNISDCIKRYILSKAC